MEEDHRLLIQAMWMNNITDQKNKIVKGKNMKLKRVLSGVIGFPIVALIFIYGNKYIIDAFIGIISIIAMYEYLKCLSVDYKPVK